MKNTQKLCRRQGCSALLVRQTILDVKIEHCSRADSAVGLCQPCTLPKVVPDRPGVQDGAGDILPGRHIDDGIDGQRKAGSRAH